mgnify:CR=1 FL=1
MQEDDGDNINDIDNDNHDDNDNNNDAIQFWKYNSTNKCVDFYYDLQGKKSEKDTVSAMTSCDDLLITGHADKCIKILKIENLIRFVDSIHMRKLTSSSGPTCASLSLSS